MEISADYADYVRGSDVVREVQHACPANKGAFTAPFRTAPNRNLRNLCNLRILNSGLSSADRC
jgi:hypothetical protein